MFRILGGIVSFQLLPRKESATGFLRTRQASKIGSQQYVCLINWPLYMNIREAYEETQYFLAVVCRVFPFQLYPPK